MTKKITSVFIAIIMAVTATVTILPVMAAGNTTEFAGGTGDGNDPYIIKTYNHLENVRKYLTAHFRMESDITFPANHVFQPIGESGTYKTFSGVFDGNGYTIHNLNVSGTSRVGLFGQTNTATIQNLKINGGRVFASGTGTYSGALVGYAQNTLYITNCEVYVNVEGKQYAGGLVGYGQHTEIRDCTFTGSVSGTSNVGGIIGKTNKTTNTKKAVIARCRVILPPDATSTLVSVFGTSGPVGGIAGDHTGTIEQCYTNVKVHGSKEVGGIAGSLVTMSSTPGEIYDCYTTGEISSASGGETGGIAGNATGSSSVRQKIIRCYSTADVISGGNGKKTGGIVGDSGTGTSYVEVDKSIAINRKIHATYSTKSRTGTVNIGKVAGTQYCGYGLFYASTSVQLINSSTYPSSVYKGNDGSPATVANTTNQNFYEGTLGWDFKNIWKMDNSSPYPVFIPTFPDVNIKEPIIFVEEEATSEFEATPTIPNDEIIDWEYESEYISVAKSGDTIYVTGKKQVYFEGISPIPSNLTLITAMGGKKHLTVMLTRQPVPDDLTEVAVAVEKGNSIYLGGVGRDQKTLDNTGYKWSSNNPEIASVSINGRVDGKELGKAIITAKKNGLEAHTTVIVRDAPIINIESIRFEEEYIKIPFYGAFDTGVDFFSPTYFDNMIIEPANYTHLDLDWIVSDENAAAITKTGKLYISEPKSITVTVISKYDNSIQATIIIDASPELTSMEIADPGTEIKVGDTLPLGLITYPEGANSPVNWDSTNKTVATIDQYGVVTGLFPGYTTITATSLNNITASKVIEVIPDVDSQDFVLADFSNATYEAPYYYADKGEYGTFNVSKNNAAYLSFLNTTYVQKNNNGIVANNWNASSLETPKAYMVTLSTKGCTEFDINFKQIATTFAANLVTDFEVQYSTTGLNDDWHTVKSYTINTQNSPYDASFVLESAVPTIYIRWYCSSPMGIKKSDGTPARLGPDARVGIDNIVIEGTKYYN
ncbi:MAG: Ig-like domain-containing protein [Eubacterium sp.]|jgi:hypothetical protein|nr:Ig-like domain-containing protein [Eubacterium sp.]